MKSIQGFVSIQQFISNHPGETSAIGELTLLSRTYTKESGQYRSNDVPGYLLNSFSVRDVDTGEEGIIDQTQTDLILNIIREVVAYATTHTIPYDVQDMRVQIAANHFNTVNDLDFGKLVYGHNIELPEFVTFNTPLDNGAYVKVWLANQSFLEQYTDYSITVVPPIDNLDSFFRNYAEVLVDLDKVTLPVMGDRVQQARNSDPDSLVKFLEFDFVNRYNSIAKRSTPWGYLFYGKEGNYIDSILDKTIEYLKANSSYSEADWETIFPDMFKRTEFLIVPRWDKVATNNATDSSSLYSQLIGTFDLGKFSESFLTFFDAGYVKNNTYSITFPWRTLQATVTNGFKNAKGKTDFKKMFPDYIPVPIVDNPDFGRMELETQEWARFIQPLLMHAETVTPGTFLPVGFRRVMRGNKMFVASSHKNVNYLVAAKWNTEFN